MPTLQDIAKQGVAEYVKSGLHEVEMVCYQKRRDWLA